MKRLLALLLVMSLVASAHAQYATGGTAPGTGLQMLAVPEGSVSKVKTVVDAQIENIGFDRIFVALPSDWTLQDLGTSATSYAVLETGLWRKYGDPADRTSLLGSGQVYKEKGTPTKLYVSVSNRTGWWLRPNEGAVLHFTIDPFSCSGSIDPLAIEKANPSIIVKKWAQEFTVTPSTAGFITAPCVVEGAALTVASPSPISDVTQKPSSIYYQEYDPAKDAATQVQIGQVPSWDSWFTLTGSLASVLSTKSISGMEPQISKANITIAAAVATQTPVWRIEDLRDIFYHYEWERGKVLTGIELIKTVSLTGVPEWFDWF